MPEDVKRIIAVLESAGYEGFAVGGCVRDAILGKEPNDWDITTSALPNQVKELFSRTIDTGIQHGTVTVMMGKTGYEVTTYRIDGEYEDMRHPKSVEFSTNLREDLKRRDFTINAMAYNDSVGIVDEFGGQADLEAGIIRCVGKATERFTEDALRMMRAIRFAAQLGFTIEEGTWQAILELSTNIAKVSRERIAVELGKTIMSDRPEYVKLYSECNIAKATIAELDEAVSSKTKDIVLAATKVSRKLLPLRYAALMSELKEPATTNLLKGLKLDNSTIKCASMLVSNEDYSIDTTEYSVRLALNKLGKENLLLLLEYQENILLAKEQVIGMPMVKARTTIGKLRAMVNYIVDRGDCYTIAGLAVGGEDMKAAGLAGRDIGDKLNSLLSLVLENPALNTKEYLLSTIK